MNSSCRHAAPGAGARCDILCMHTKARPNYHSQAPVVPSFFGGMGGGGAKASDNGEKGGTFGVMFLRIKFTPAAKQALEDTRFFVSIRSRPGIGPGAHHFHYVMLPNPLKGAGNGSNGTHNERVGKG